GRYTPKGSHIEITAHIQPGSVLIRIADNGPGLPPGTEQRVFDKFFRGTGSAAPDQRRGVGLGLTICQSILEAHGGKIEARNCPEGGAEFLLTMPCREQPPKVALDESTATTGA